MFQDANEQKCSFSDLQCANSVFLGMSVDAALSQMGQFVCICCCQQNAFCQHVSIGNFNFSSYGSSMPAMVSLDSHRLLQ